ncbi:hypothetical protein BH11PSE11_BH11PSE11_21530 [soil metagenome]
MTVDELIVELHKLSEFGHGNKTVWAGSLRVTGEFSWAEVKVGDVYFVPPDRVEIAPD